MGVSRRDLPLSRVREALPKGVDPAVVLSLVATFKDRSQWPSGSAVAISDYFALTAKHVLEDYQERAAPEDTMIRAASGLDERHKQREWVVRATVTEPGTEIALLYFGESGGPIRGLKFPVLAIAPPEPDSKAIAVGFAESTAEPIHEDTWAWREKPVISTGRVTEIHGQRRDAVMLPYPSASTECFVQGGMSGGPVFNEDGDVIGIISTSNEDLESPYAAFTLIWTALGLPLSMLPQFKERRDFLFDLAVRLEILTANISRLDARYGVGPQGPTLLLELRR